MPCLLSQFSASRQTCGFACHQQPSDAKGYLDLLSIWVYWEVHSSPVLFQTLHMPRKTGQGRDEPSDDSPSPSWIPTLPTLQNKKAGDRKGEKKQGGPPGCQAAFRARIPRWQAVLSAECGRGEWGVVRLGLGWMSITHFRIPKTWALATDFSETICLSEVSFLGSRLNPL